MQKPFTLEDLEAQVARTQGRGPLRGFGGLDLLAASLAEETLEAVAASIRHVQALRSSWGQGDAGQAEREALKLELGDVLNVAVALVMHHGLTLREVAEANDVKMRARMPEGCGQ